MSEPDGPVEVVETHVSTLLFMGERVYKLKKHVDLGFVDFTSREARRLACQREVDLNRRLAPDVYLGVADVVMDGASLEHVVVMRRLPPERRLSRLVTSGADIDRCLRQVAHLLATFHDSCERSELIDAAGRPEALLGNWIDNFRQMQPFVGEVLDAATASSVEYLARRYIEGRHRLLQARVGAGRICDGHGDLQAEDIFCLDDGPRVLDCIEFSDRLRAGDVVADIGFLAMDLERLGAGDAATSFVKRYRELSADSWPDSLLDHYIAYRAHVRSKVACFRHAQGDTAAAREAGRLLALCAAHLRRGQVTLVLVGGLPGTGKSHLSAGLAEALGWTVLRSDEIRKDLAGVDRLRRLEDPYGAGLYSPQMTADTYREVLRRAALSLELGQSVILDASWNSGQLREEAVLLAQRTHSRCLQLRCVLDAATAEERIRQRQAVGKDPSDASADTAFRMAMEATPWPQATVIDTSGSAKASLEQALGLLG